MATWVWIWVGVWNCHDPAHLPYPHPCHIPPVFVFEFIPGGPNRTETQPKFTLPPPLPQASAS